MLLTIVKSSLRQLPPRRKLFVQGDICVLAEVQNARWQLKWTTRSLLTVLLEILLELIKDLKTWYYSWILWKCSIKRVYFKTLGEDDVCLLYLSLSCVCTNGQMAPRYFYIVLDFWMITMPVRVIWHFPTKLKWLTNLSVLLYNPSHALLPHKSHASRSLSYKNSLQGGLQVAIFIGQNPSLNLPWIIKRGKQHEAGDALRYCVKC